MLKIIGTGSRVAIKKNAVGRLQDHRGKQAVVEAAKYFANSGCILYTVVLCDKQGHAIDESRYYAYDKEVRFLERLR